MNTITPQRAGRAVAILCACKHKETMEDQNAAPVGPSSESLEFRDSPVIRGLQIRKGSTLGIAGETYTPAQADIGQITTLERDISRLRAQLAETRGFDRKTGQPVPVYTDEARANIDRRLKYLESVQLPYVRTQVAAAQAWLAENVPSTEGKMAAEAERRDSIKQRAVEIADEREAQKLAATVAATRRSGRQW